MRPKILISAGEASGDLYAGALAERLRGAAEADLFGCVGPHMRAAGVRQVVDAARLSVVGLAEVVGHIPRVWADLRRMVRAARRERPDLAVLTDSPDFHLPLARQLKRIGVPVVYMVAPQVWAWREGRIRAIRRNTDRLLCIFPFEEAFFRRRGVKADYIGHPLVRLAKPRLSRGEFLRKHDLTGRDPVVALLPGSRRGEAFRHMGKLVEAAAILRQRAGARSLLGAPAGFWSASDGERRRRLAECGIGVAEGETWDLLAHSDLALAASGTVTVEAAILGTPMVTFYRVSPLSWALGRPLVKVPFYSMVNLIAGYPVVAELIQNEMKAERLASEALRLLEDPQARGQMRRQLAEAAARLGGEENPIERAAGIVHHMLQTDQGAPNVA